MTWQAQFSIITANIMINNWIIRFHCIPNETWNFIAMQCIHIDYAKISCFHSSHTYTLISPVSEESYILEIDICKKNPSFSFIIIFYWKRFSWLLFGTFWMFCIVIISLEISINWYYLLIRCFIVAIISILALHFLK